MSTDSLIILFYCVLQLYINLTLQPPTAVLMSLFFFDSHREQRYWHLIPNHAMAWKKRLEAMNLDFVDISTA